MTYDSLSTSRTPDNRVRHEKPNHATTSPDNRALEQALDADESDREFDGLWERFWAKRDVESRNALVIAYERVVEQVAARLPANIRGYWDIDDLKSFGVLGLMEAIDRFEPGSVSRRFPAYASKRVRGAIFDELRRLDWLPRTVRRRVISYRATIDTLSNEFSRPPSREEVFNSMNVTPTDGAKLLVEVQSAQLLHLEHGHRQDEEGSDQQHLGLIGRIASDPEAEPEPVLMASEELAELRKAISGLPDRQRTVVTLHFLAGLTQGQIGNMLGISHSRVCQIEASAMQSLRRVFERNGAMRAG